MFSLLFVLTLSAVDINSLCCDLSRIQGEKGNRGPVLRPKMRRFVIMKGDAGPPGLKGKADYLMRCKTRSALIVGDRGDSIIGPKGDRGAPGLPGRYGAGLSVQRISMRIRAILLVRDFLETMVVTARMVRKEKWDLRDYREEG